MRRQPVLVAVLVWTLVVVAASTLTWTVIDAAGQNMLADDTVSETQPVPTTVASSRGPREHGTADASPTRSSRPASPRTTEESPSPAPTSSRTTAAAEPSDPPVRPEGVSGTWEGRPGLVTVRCVEGRPRFVSATPSNGYRFEVEQEGEGELEVKFESATREFKVAATCPGGGPRYTVEADEG